MEIDEVKLKHIQDIKKSLKEKGIILDNQVVTTIVRSQFDMYVEGMRRGLKVNIPKIGVFINSNSERLVAIKEELRNVTEGVKKKDYSLHAKKVLMHKIDELKKLQYILGTKEFTLEEFLEKPVLDMTATSKLSSSIEDERQKRAVSN